MREENVRIESGLGRTAEGKPTCAVLRVRDTMCQSPKLGAEESNFQSEVLVRWSEAKATCAVLRVRRKLRKPARAWAETRESKLCLVSGDNSLRDPPVPIPNTEVKPQHADSTWLETAR